MYDTTVNESDLIGNGSMTAFPYELTFNADSVQEIAVYSCLFAVASAGNIPVFVSLLRNRHRKSRIKLMIMHLAIADLIVTFVMIPLEVAWRVTVSWLAGNVACKVLFLLRAFGPYLSSAVLVCISVDRYFAILHPLRVNDAQRRSKIMLAFAWLISFVCSVPQSIVFHVESHPDHPQFQQCVTFNFFPSAWHDMVYNMFCLMALYGVPLVIIVYCYSRILYVIFRRSRESTDESLRQGESPFPKRLQLRCSHMAHIERARNRTLRMTIVIVLAFFWCWTPYVLIVLWYQFDSDSAGKLDHRLQSSLFMFAVSNSCVNPIVYGSYAIPFKQIFKRCFATENLGTELEHHASRRTIASTATRITNIDNECRLNDSRFMLSGDMSRQTSRRTLLSGSRILKMQEPDVIQSTRAEGNHSTSVVNSVVTQSQEGRFVVSARVEKPWGLN